MHSIASALKIFCLSIAVFAASFAIRHAFLPNVVAIAWAEEPQALWAVEAAFLLRAVENVAVISAVIVLGLACAGGVGRLIRSKTTLKPPAATNP
jgi:hypothetical protein